MAQRSMKYVKRVQAMFTEHQYALLQAHAEQVDKPVGVLVREAVEQCLLADLEQWRKKEALDWLFSQELPVDDWEAMEQQIESRQEEPANE